VLRDMIAPASLAGVHIFFPDPWPKKRHHKRRLLQPRFQPCWPVACAGGYLHCATDWQDYASRCWPCCQPKRCSKTRRRGYAPRPDYRPLTKFEQRGLRLGHGVWDLVFRRRPESLQDGR
jgi:tRNA (guanine-N7-)-methyltransferase